MYFRIIVIIFFLWNSIWNSEWNLFYIFYLWCKFELPDWYARKKIVWIYILSPVFPQIIPNGKVANNFLDRNNGEFTKNLALNFLPFYQHMWRVWHITYFGMNVAKVLPVKYKCNVKHIKIRTIKLYAPHFHEFSSF